MKNAMKKLMSLALVAILLVSAVPFAASAAVGDPITFSIYQQVDGVDDVKTATVTATADRIQIADVCAQLGIAADEFEGCWINGNKKGYGDDMPGDAASITEAKIRKVAKVTPVAPAPVVRKDITWELKYVEGGNVVSSGSFTPNGEQANAKDILYYHVFNRSNDWQNDYTCTKVWSRLSQANVGYEGKVPEGDTVTFVLTAKTPACTTHKYNDGVVTTPATSTSTGIKTFTCTVCGATKEEELPKIADSIITEKKPMVILDLNYQGAPKYYIELDSTYTTWANVLLKIENLYGTFSRDGYTFAGWYWDNDFDHKVKNEEYVSSSMNAQVTIYAKWAVNQNTPKVLMYLHTDRGIKDDPINITSYGLTDGVIDIYEALKVARQYYNFKNYSGLYTDASWTTETYVTTDSVSVNNDDLTIVHLKITGATLPTNSSSSSNTADSSNPKTGDAIFAPIFVLGLSASALAVMFYLNKKRAV